MQKELVSGLYPKYKNEKAPDFVLWKGSINLKQMLEFCQKKIGAGEEWVNYDVLQPKDATKKPYAVVNDWKPENKQTQTVDITDVPF